MRRIIHRYRVDICIDKLVRDVVHTPTKVEQLKLHLAGFCKSLGYMEVLFLRWTGHGARIRI